MSYFDLTVTDEMLNSTVTSLALIDDYSIALRKDGKTEYIYGKIKKVRKTLGFKVWDSNIVKFFKENDVRKKYLNITFKGSEWNGMREINITAVSVPQDGCVDTTEFESPIEYEELFNEFGAYIANNIEPKWTAVINTAFTAVAGTNMYERFKLEYAGASMHDAIPGGLLNHTVKMLKIFDLLYASDKRIEPYVQLIRVGIILHDLGKVEEMKDGVYQKNAFIVPHRVKGVCYLERSRSEILKNITEDELARLESIILTHHNGYGGAETCSTIYALIVHLIDNLDAQVTGIMDKLENVQSMKKNTAGESYINLGDSILYI